MGLELPEDASQQLQELQACVSRLDVLLQPILDTDAKVLESQLGPLQRAHVHLAVAQSAHVLMQLYLRAVGVDPADHAVAKEAERLRLYAKRVRKADAATELATSSRSLTLDVAAANRFIDHAITDLTSQQRAALKDASQRAAAKSDAAAAQCGVGGAASASGSGASAAGGSGGACQGGQGGAQGAGAAAKRVRDPSGATRAVADSFIEDTLAGLMADATREGGSRKAGDKRKKKRRESGGAQ